MPLDATKAIADVVWQEFHDEIDGDRPSRYDLEEVASWYSEELYERRPRTNAEVRECLRRAKAAVFAGQRSAARAEVAR